MKSHQVVILPAVVFSIWVFNLISFLPDQAPVAKLGQISTPTLDVSFAAQQAGQLFQEGFALHQSGDMQGALDAYNQALSLYRIAQDPAGEGKTLSNMGFVYKDLGQYDLALNSYQQALIRLREAGDRFNEGTAVNNLALVYLSLGQYKQALDYLEQALALRHEAGDQLGEGVTLSNFGIAYSELGEYEKALSYLQRALVIRREVSDSVGEAASLNAIGLTYWRLKQPGPALGYYQQALTIYKEIEHRVGQASVLNNIGETYYDAGVYEQALDYYQQALDIFQEIGVKAGEGTILNNIGETYHKLDQPEHALEYFQKSLAILQEIKVRVTEGVVLNNIGEVYADQGQYTEALKFYEQALAIRAEVGDRTGKVKTLHNIGWVNEQRGDKDKAINAYQQAIDVIESIESELKIEELKASFASGQVETYERLINLLWTEGRGTDAFFYAERARARAFLDQLARGTVDFRVGVDATLLDQEHALKTEIASLRAQLTNLHNKSEVDRNTIATVEAELTQREAEYSQLLTEIKIQNPEVASLVSVDVTTLHDVQSLLDTKTTLVEYFVATNYTLAFLITHDTFETIRIDASRDDLGKMITSFRDFASLNNPYPASLKHLYSRLIAPLKAKLKTPVVGIIPHGVLHYLPFAALTDGERYLSDDHILFTLPSASVLRFIPEKRKAKSGPLIALGNPTLNESLPVLHFAEQEVKTISNLYETSSFVREQATETMIWAQARNAGILHLAAHGEYNPKNPLFSAIRLAADSENDGRLEVHEIYGLNLTAVTDLVVLSACQTQVGLVSAGDEVVGLSRAFIYAGTPTVIASLWNVDDAVTSTFMEQFYTHLRAGMGKAQALQQAQSEVRAQYPHPYYWAAFVLTGDPGDTRGQIVIREVTPTANSKPDHNGGGPCGSIALSLGVLVLWLKTWRRQ